MNNCHCGAEADTVKFDHCPECGCEYFERWSCPEEDAEARYFERMENRDEIMGFHDYCEPEPGDFDPDYW